MVASEGKKSMNPKRMQRIAKKQMQEKGIGTKAQQALKEQQEQGKLERKAVSKAEKEAEKATVCSRRLWTGADGERGKKKAET